MGSKITGINFATSKIFLIQINFNELFDFNDYFNGKSFEDRDFSFSSYHWHIEFLRRPSLVSGPILLEI